MLDAAEHNSRTRNLGKLYPMPGCIAGDLLEAPSLRCQSHNDIQINYRRDDLGSTLDSLAELFKNEKHGITDLLNKVVGKKISGTQNADLICLQCNGRFSDQSMMQKHSHICFCLDTN